MDSDIKPHCKHYIVIDGIVMDVCTKCAQYRDERDRAIAMLRKHEFDTMNRCLECHGPALKHERGCKLEAELRSR